MTPAPLRAHVELQDDLTDLPGAYCVVLSDGRVAIERETFGVCSAVADAINHPENWHPIEAQEIADQIRKGK